ncbi:MAG: transporter permease, partial [Aeromicrobium sp.]|nr:transporter permease [Aeromicrobium sp.]
MMSVDVTTEPTTHRRSLSEQFWTQVRSDLHRYVTAPLRAFDEFGEQVGFYVKAVVGLRYAVVRYRREVLRLIARVTFGSGALAVV